MYTYYRIIDSQLHLCGRMFLNPSADIEKKLEEKKDHCTVIISTISMHDNSKAIIIRVCESKQWKLE
jgi:hypothetical protein